MFKRSLIILLVLLTTFTFMSCNTKNNSVSNKKSNKLNVVVSFNPLYQFANAIGKDKIDIHVIIPPGTEAHDFEPNVQDLKNLSTADIFIYNGLSMEPWANETIKSVSNEKLIVVEASKGCNLIKNTDSEEIKEHGEYDPHTWLSLNEANTEALNIKNAFVKADPENKDFYEKNYIAFSNELKKLHSEYKDKFSKLTRKNFVTGHAAFAYLCRDFNLNQNSVEDVFSSGEPTPKKLEDLIKYCKENKVTTIFMEDMASPKVSETLAKEVNAKVEKIDTIESKEDNKNYIESMKSNLEKVYISLQ